MTTNFKNIIFPREKIVDPRLRCGETLLNVSINQLNFGTVE